MLIKTLSLSYMYLPLFQYLSYLPLFQYLSYLLLLKFVG